MDGQGTATPPTRQPATSKTLEIFNQLSAEIRRLKSSESSLRLLDQLKIALFDELLPAVQRTARLAHATIDAPQLTATHVRKCPKDEPPLRAT